MLDRPWEEESQLGKETEVLEKAGAMVWDEVVSGLEAREMPLANPLEDLSRMMLVKESA